MAKQLRYMGEFLSRAGVTWHVEILQEADEAFASVGSLDFEADEALVIEWSRSDKESVICGSGATLRIISPGDRTYEDLYTIIPGRIRMDVYRDGSLYWSGMLDPEFYEEPYEKADNYTVSLTFSDFGILDRLKYDMSGMKTLQEIVTSCVTRSGINTTIDESLISTSLTPGGDAMSLADLKVRSDNFYDEDGEAMTLEEVMKGVLQPLGLRIIQRAGKVYVHDLNALYMSAPVSQVEWNGDSQTMGTDKVYNNAKITWNTYVQSSELTDEEWWEGGVDPNFTALNSLGGKDPYSTTVPFSTVRVFSYHYGSNPRDVDIRTDYTATGFSLWTSPDGKNATLKDSSVRFFKLVPQNEGSESEGVAITWVSTAVSLPSDTNKDFAIQNNGFYTSLPGIMGVAGTPLFSTVPCWIPPVSKVLDLHITLETLIDPRINFFNEAENFHTEDAFMKIRYEKAFYDDWKKNGNFVFVPVRVLFNADDGSVYCWDNRATVNGSYNVKSIELSKGQWVSYTGAEFGYLSYYDPKDRKYSCGVLGWQRNRPAINPHDETLTVAMQQATGQYIPYPQFGSKGGTLTVEVLSGWVVTNQRSEDKSALMRDGKMEWAMCKIPSVEIVNTSLFDKEINTDDVEYNAEINTDAKEPYEIETICGSSAEGVPTARGAYFNATTGAQVTALTRAGRTSQVEDLLIGTLFSQFGSRHTKLSGEMEILKGGLGVYTEANQQSKKFMVTDEVQDVITDTSDATITELRPDEYKKKEV